MPCGSARRVSSDARPAVTTDPDIYRAAKLLIDQHGTDAGLRAAERADELLGAGDMIGATTWRRILICLRHSVAPPRLAISTDTLDFVGFDPLAIRPFDP